MSLVLGILSLCALVAAALAVTDILHGEDDTGLEETVLRIAFIVIFLFEVFAILTLRRVLREPEPGQGTDTD